MPLGISFYSFAAIAYLIDAARGDCEVEKNPVHCALFLNFFATVTQGPICRAGALLPQFRQEHRFDAGRTVRGLRLMALGLFKLVAVSDVLGVLVDQVFPHYRDYGGPLLILAAVAYTLQLYFNFSGYSEVARAVGLFLGLDLPEKLQDPLLRHQLFRVLEPVAHQLFLLAAGLPLPAAGLGRPERPHPGAAGPPARRSLRVHGVLPFGVLARQHAALCDLGAFAGLLPPGRRTAAPPSGQTQKESPRPGAVGQTGRGVRPVVREHGVLPGGFGLRRRSPDHGRRLRLPGRVVPRLEPRPLCRGTVQRRLHRVLCQRHHVAGYYAFLLAALALALRLDARRAFRYKNKPSEVALAGEKHRWALYYLLVIFLLAGYILQSGGFGNAGFGMYAGF